MPVREGRTNRPSVGKARMAHQFIQEAIVSGQLTGGQFLNEGDLATRLKMSRTPVREALARLAKDRLVELVPGRGAFVSEILLSDLQDVFELRKVLECYAAEESVARITDEQIEDIKAAWHEIEGLLEQGEDVGYDRVSFLDNRFHALITDNCSNKRLRDFIHLLNQETLRYQLVTAQALGDIANTVGQHVRLLSLLEARDSAGFVQELRNHIEAGESVLLAPRRVPFQRE